MSGYEALKKIPLTYDYSYLKKDFETHCEDMMKPTPPCTPIQSVCGALHYYYDVMIEENGMDRLAVIILGFLFEMKHNDVDPDLAYAVNWHIQDFEKGEYESLFSEEDLDLLKNDISRVKDYLKEYFIEHPEALEE